MPALLLAIQKIVLSINPLQK